MPEVVSQTLEFVGRELNAAMAEARAALETYVEQPQNVGLLERCTRELHQVQGVLKVLEIYGAALLAEEMEQVARYLLATAAEHKNQAESLDALMRAMVQLPSYLERVLAGGRDLALVLLPLLNDLRAVRGSALLSEGTLLLLNLKSDRQAQPAAAAPGEPQLTVEQWARRLRVRFQIGLVGWIRGERLDTNVEILAGVAQKLEQIATRQPVFQLWWVTGAVLEALRDNGLEGGVSVKRLLGLADREIKRLYEQGEARYAQAPPIELLNNLLYYVGRATVAGPRVTAVRASFRLSELLPVDESVEQERESLSAPSVKLMQTVAAAIREDFGRVKDVLDIFVRRGSGQREDLAPQVQLLRKIGDTLGVLGLGELRANVQREAERLEKIVGGQLEPDEATLVEIAATLIGVEDRLDDRLVGMILPREAAVRDDPDAEFREVQAAVLRECILNLARLKESVSQNVGGTLDAAGLDGWHELLRGLKAGLLMLGKTRAVELVEAIHARLKPVMQPGGGALSPGGLDRLADAIVSLEYYMETLQAGRSDPWYMLDNAQACLQALDAEPAREVPTVAPVEPSAFAQTVQLPRPPGSRLGVPDTGGVPADARGASADSRPRAGAAPTLGPSQAAPLAESADPELVALFIEEAREELDRITRSFPVWEQNPLEQSALATVRRSFHTLKGSGRMVGARDLSEFAWAIENLLNRLLDNTLTRSLAISAVLRDAVGALPQLIEQLETGAAPRSGIASIITRAHSLAAGREVAPAPAATDEDEPTSPAPVAAAAPRVAGPAQPAVPDGFEPTAVAAASSGELSDSDDALRDIYARETATHVAVVRAYLARESGKPAPHALAEEVYRACHTLSGSSKMADARHGVRLAQPLDHWLRKAFESGIGLEQSDLALLGECMSAMDSVAAHLDESTGYFASHALLSSRIAAAEQALDRRVAAGSEPATPPAGSTQHAAPAHHLATPAHHEALAHPAAATAPVAQTGPPELPPDFDPEVASIFTEEATELLEAAEAALAAWRDEPHSAERLAALKRPLHTLKGGARMAGILAMGDLSHELETLVNQVDVGSVPAGDLTFATLQASLDELASMRDAVAAGRGVAPARDAIARIRALSQQAEAPPASAAQTPAQAPAASPGVAPPVATVAASAEHRAFAEPAGMSAPAAQAAPIQQGAPIAQAATPGAMPESPHGASRPWESSQVESSPAEPWRSEPSPAEPSSQGVAPAHASLDLSSADAAPKQTVPPPRAPVFPPRGGNGGQRGVAAEEGLHAPQPVPPGREPVPPGDRPEMARVDAELLDQLLNIASEVSISRARLEQQMGSFEFNLGELSRTVTRLKEQLRKLELETETQILHRHEDEAGHRSDFDPLELDRYSTIQQFSRALAETASDVASIQQLLETMAQDTQNLLQQQARTVTELQNGLMRTRMVPFQRHVQRLARIVRQAAADTDKRAELMVEGASGELDRQVLERMLPPFEHMLRNAVVHGIEKPEDRTARGKSASGTIRLALQREGAEVTVKISDDGAGMNLAAIREKGAALGLVAPGRTLSDEDAMQLILEPGFSTAGTVTQQAGRGVGMDVVATEIKRLGGALHMETRAGEATEFTIRLPFTLAISHALVVRTGDEFYALPLPTVEGVLRLSKAEVSQHLGHDVPAFEHGGQKYRFQHLATFVGLEPSELPEADITIPVVLVRAGEHSTALIADELIGSREIVVKPVGPQISSIRGISGATILGDGRIVIILDIGALVRGEWRGRAPAVVREKADRRTLALVVDDSITVRRVTQRLLERNGMRVLAARDGLDALTVLEEHVPDVILLDIEMPRMDGYEVAAHVRGDPRLKDVPIIMITSRTGEKHRARAIELGVDDFLGKPYQEAQLLDAIAPLVERRRDAGAVAQSAELGAAAAT
ncbi:MAG: Hpt domain-containing protein [Steroidobacteraceae bacterium]